VRGGGWVVPDCGRPLGWWAAIICATGCMAARPIWPIWRCCAGLIIGRSMRGGGWSAGLLAASPPPQPTDNPTTGRIDDILPPPEPARQGGTIHHRAPCRASA
jgi:hypothetical protein